ncbi:histidine--tRNA ligase [Candidatus Raskinella chloraquaticus]|uniref:Histidine--tRNA ligase n=1 Tax=Candidatus Raskinella chloraquaticus TaxID=1951219 RepID=A0A1W9HWU7_9HYPH|nr:MAG: histidine--tRNA ligase [Proteobacteria bacterium SG_bin8]
MSQKPAKPQRLKARLPRGLADRPASELRATDAMLGKIRKVYELYGFEPVETPFIEYTEGLGKFLPDQDRPNEGVFSFQDDDEAWLSLRYDLTAPLARYVAENFEALAKPYRSYRLGWVFRNEKPGPGRFRQFMQFDADTVGSGSPAADAEICMMAADALEALGIPRGQYVIKVNNRKILDGVMEAIGLGGEENAGRRLTVLRAIDKADKFPWEEVTKLLGSGRLDESGDFTKGAGLAENEIAAIHAYLHASVQVDGALFLVRMASPQIDQSFSAIAAYREGIAEIQDMFGLIQAAGYGPDRIKADFSVVRGLEYYTGPVFEAELLFEVKDEKGNPVRFGSVGGGGRYDGLVGRFRPEPVPATGFSIGVSRLAAALKVLGRLDGLNAPGPVVVTVFDKDRLADYQSMVARLRAAGIAAEMYLGSAGLKAQMKYADRRKSPCVIIQGGDEKAAGKIQIKDLIEGAKADEAIVSHTERKEQRPAQIEVDESALVESVQAILARHFPAAG